MSESTRDTVNTTVTIWPIASKDSLGTITYGSPYIVRCTFNQGANRQYSDGSGAMYVPNSIFWYEYNGIYPSLNDKIAIGDHRTTLDPINVNGVEVIKNRLRQGEMDDIDDIMVLT